MRIYADYEKLLYSGRIDWSDRKAPVWVFPCTSVKMRFTGDRLTVFTENRHSYWDNYLGCILDGEQTKILLPDEGMAELSVPVNHHDKAAEHEVLIFKRQDSCHELAFLGFEIGDGGRILDPGKAPERKIEVYGDSVSAGEVSEAIAFTGKEDPEHDGEYSNSWYSYAWITARKLNAEIHDIAQGGIALIDKTGWFCEPEAVGMETAWNKIHYNPQLSRATEWDFANYTPQVVIVAIGQNDSHPEDYMKEAYEGEKAARWRAHYREFLKRLRAQYPAAHIICCTTLLTHDPSWDRAICEVTESLQDEKITQYRFRRNGCGTPGHLRIAEAEEMAEELCAYIEEIGVEGWNME